YVRKAIARGLRPAHEVVEAASAQDALELLVTGPPFDVILCDLMMPELTGMDLHDRLVEIRPDLAARIVFMTGGTFTPRAEAFLGSGRKRSIAKPFSLAALHEAVSRSLHEPERPPPGS